MPLQETSKKRAASASWMSSDPTTESMERLRQMRLMTAIRAFFAALGSAATAEKIRIAMETPTLPAPEKKDSRPTPSPPKQPTRSEAITLLAALQREARFVDLTQESLDEYTDAQVGAATRDVLRDCRDVLARIFDLTPVLDQDEGADVEVPAGFEAGRIRLTGNVSGQAPFRGSLVHHGWQAARCELPKWSGSDQTARVIAPAEVELP
jgi:hypothetical protein